MGGNFWHRAGGRVVGLLHYLFCPTSTWKIKNKIKIPKSLPPWWGQVCDLEKYYLRNKCPCLFTTLVIDISHIDQGLIPVQLWLIPSPYISNIRRCLSVPLNHQWREEREKIITIAILHLERALGVKKRIACSENM